MACRSLKKAKDAVKEIEQDSNGVKVGHLVVMELNMGSLKSIRKFVEDFKSSNLFTVRNNETLFLMFRLKG